MLGLMTLGTMAAFLDQTAKNMIESGDEKDFPKEVKETKGLLWLYRNHNHGFAFDRMKDRPELVSGATLFATGALAGIWAYVCGEKTNMAKKLGITLALAGAASNACDRVKRGYVVDYINVRFKDLAKVVFNLGDALLLAGMSLFTGGALAENLRGAARKKA